VDPSEICGGNDGSAGTAQFFGSNGDPTGPNIRGGTVTRIEQNPCRLARATRYDSPSIRRFDNPGTVKWKSDLSERVTSQTSA